jgi:HAD superfamily hydrolase (TIGR01549 family)
MTLTALLDLDDTLLISDMNKFLPAYLQALGSFLEDFPAEETIRQVMIAIRRMEMNRDPSKTLEKVFDESFYPGLGINKKAIWHKIVNFYSDVFPTLQSITKPKPGAAELVDYLFEQGHRVIIATNPLFPQAATFHRLAWAGLPVNRYPFMLVSTYESFHFSKPDPAYYAELLAQAGWPSDPVVMIGDDYDMDILPAAKIGIPAFWISNQAQPDDMPVSVRAGDIADVIPWLNKISNAVSELHFEHPQAHLAILRSTPAALDALTHDFSEQDWKRRSQNDEWSPTEIVCHLRDVDQEVNWPRLQKVISEENPFLPGVATDPWAEERQYYQEDGKAALTGFLEIRNTITDLLSKFDPLDWNKTARHAIFGPTQIKELTSFIATHDRVHIGQIKKALHS